MRDGSSGRHVFDDDLATVAGAIKQFEAAGSGPLKLHYSCVPAAFLKHDDVSHWPSFARLPKDQQDLLLKPTVPHFEIPKVSYARS